MLPFAVDGRRLEETAAWSEIQEELATGTVAQVAHRRGLAASVIRSAMRRTGVGTRVRVVRPSEAPEADAAPTPMPSPRSLRRPRPQRIPSPKPEPKPAVRPAPVRPPPSSSTTPVAAVDGAPRPAAPQPPVAMPAFPAIPEPAWAWKVLFADTEQPEFTIAPNLAAAAAKAERTGRTIARIDRYAPALAG